MKVLVADNMSEKGIDIFRGAKGITVDVNTGLKPEELIKIIGEYDGVAIRSATKITADIIAAAKKLKVVGRAGIGVDNVDIAEASKKGIVVMNTPGGNTITTAEHSIAMMLSLSRNIPQATASMREGKWEKKKFIGKEVFNKTLGIIGLGNIGRIVASRGIGLKMRVIASDPFISQEAVDKLGVELVSNDEIFKQSDFITVHTPKTEETTSLLCRKAFKKMKKGVFIINCARGGIVNEEDLLWAIEEGIVAGAALDVYVKEPPEPSPLLNNEKVILTPHLGASTEEAQVNVAVLVAEQIVDYLLKGVVRNAINMPSVSPEDLTVLKPYIELSEVMGSFISQLGLPGLKEIEIEYRGEISTMDVRPLKVAVLKGIFDPILEEGANYVNAPIIADERGIKVVESKSEKVEGFTSLLGLKAKTNEGDITISGTIFGSDNPRIVKLDSFDLEAVPDGNMLVIKNLDKPGVVGGVGGVLGEAGINIARMHLGRDKEGGNALIIISVDQDVPPDVMKTLTDLPNMVTIKQVKL
ncbi:MAG: phosphoglycerate dehydrogenase [Deltaproteobacteria bacterium]|uniref:D-3-phosphoglycerate dehydrogenase n=1 Tax=Candidatus Zymogenus saltonus TaxID=2844893 RepID=A0A9D8KFP3_9DELT|nr:phosphoglycerate dehydrogenase [Candidatus Zymogenus saltonus]